MDVIVLWLLATLASYRLWRLLALDDLPGLAEARIAIADRLPSRYERAIQCPWCLGFWCCVFVFAAIDLFGYSLPLPMVQIAAASALVGLIGALDG
jgi:hypothetical protein